MTTTDNQATGTVEQVLIQSRFLGEEREAHIYLPHNYTPLYKYPVLYVNDGADYMTMGRMISLLNERFQDRNARRFLVVFVPADKPKRREQYSPLGSQQRAYIRFFADELVPLIEERYAAFPLGPARGIMGSSLGASVALHTVLEYTRKFHYLSLQSGFFVHDETYEALKGRLDLATVPVYQVIGLDEANYEATNGKTYDLVAANRRMKDALASLGVNVDYKETPGDHTWGTWQQDLPLALDHFVKHTQM
jgi:enterochelin esterase-like enzyme